MFFFFFFCMKKERCKKIRTTRDTFLCWILFFSVWGGRRRHFIENFPMIHQWILFILVALKNFLKFLLGSLWKLLLQVHLTAEERECDKWRFGLRALDPNSACTYNLNLWAFQNSHIEFAFSILREERWHFYTHFFISRFQIFWNVKNLSGWKPN